MMVLGRIGLAMLALSIGLSLPASAVGAQGAAATESQAGPQMTSGTKLFAVIYRPGPAWRPGVPMAGQTLLDHLRYYRRAASEGRVFAGGALPAIDGGLAILVMPSLEEARAFLAADPAIVNGTFVGEVNLWSPAVRSDRPLPK